MPRPRIDPKLRKRSVRACVPCKLSKVRCDSNEPCSRCSGKGRVSSCVYADSSNQPKQRPRAASQSQSQTQPLSPTEPRAQTRAQDQAQSKPQSQLQNQAEGAENALSSPQTPPEANQSRMLLNSKGEKVYIGRTASLSYLGFVRHVVKASMGPSGFTENESNDFMLEVESDNNAAWQASWRSLTQEQKRSVIEAYIESSSGVLDLFTETELDEFVTSSQFPLQNETLFPRKTRALNAALKLATAIGLQSKDDLTVGPEAAIPAFAEGQRFAFEGMLCDVSLDVVRLFLLMAFYMLGACQRNAAFMYLGIASKAASTLGLFDGREESRMLSQEEFFIRQRTWKSLCVLDTIVSAILGRYGSCSSMVAEDNIPENDNKPNSLSGSRIVNATYKMCVLIDGLEQDIRKGGSFTSSSAESFLYEVRHCSQKLPPNMRTLTHDKSTTPTHEMRVQSIGATHVACSYYFAVILATRPFLTSHLMLKLRDQGLGLLDERASFGAEERLKIGNLAQVCLDAARFMTIMVTQAMEAGLLLRNMCLLKAWIFGSGLLLGFTLFVEENGGAEVEQAFQSSLAALFHFSARSPQAKHYHDILTHLWETVNEHRRKRAEDKRKMTSQFLYPMFASGNANTPQTYPSPLSTERLDAELASHFNMDEVLSAGLDVDLSAAFAASKDLGDEFYWQPFCWGFDGG